jgi:anti-sigma regulatory factor (Ser/Thr protein kinase)
MTQFYGSLLQRRHHIDDASAIGAARRDAQRLAAELALDETTGGKLGVIVTELASNVLRHAGTGELLIQAIPGSAGTAVEVLAIDRGQGMRDVQSCLRDGYSSSGTSGTGLGAVKRLAAEFDVESLPGKGTVVMARVGSHPTLRMGAVCVPRDGETVCGDTWRMACDAQRGCALMVADGLGHGPSAAEASGQAAAAFVSHPFDPPQQQIERAHHALTNTRGAAVACALWTLAGTVAYAGIGNIAGRLTAADGSRGLVSHSGTLGFQMRRVQQFEYPASNGTLLIMHSDGLTARWDLSDHGNLRRHHPAVVAATLYRDHVRGKDDATVVVVPL